MILEVYPHLEELMATPKTQREIDQLEDDIAHDAICTEDAPCEKHGGSSCVHCGWPCVAGVNSEFCSLTCEQDYGKENDILVPDAGPTAEPAVKPSQLAQDIVAMIHGYVGLAAYLRGTR